MGILALEVMLESEQMQLLLKNMSDNSMIICVGQITQSRWHELIREGII